MEDIFTAIVNAVKAQFGKYHVQAEVVPESPQTRLIAVYNVSADDVPVVRRKIKDLDWEMCQPNGLAALAHVVNEEKTARYYPEYVRLNEPHLAVFKWYLSPASISRASQWSKPNALVCANCSSELSDAA